MTTEDILNERQKTHGEFETHAVITQELKRIIRKTQFKLDQQPAFESLPSSHKEALEMICHKIGRILNGNAHHKDHWDDIAGYATLVSKIIERNGSGK